MAKQMKATWVSALVLVLAACGSSSDGNSRDALPGAEGGADDTGKAPGRGGSGSDGGPLIQEDAPALAVDAAAAEVAKSAADADRRDLSTVKPLDGATVDAPMGKLDGPTVVDAGIDLARTEVSPLPTFTLTATLTRTLTTLPTGTLTSTLTKTETMTGTATTTSTLTATVVPTFTLTNTRTRTLTTLPTGTLTGTLTATETHTDSATATATFTGLPTVTLTNTRTLIEPTVTATAIRP